MIYSGKVGGFMAQFAKLIGEHRGVIFPNIKFQVLMPFLIEVQKSMEK
jgi:hypothetical protein